MNSNSPCTCIDYHAQGGLQSELRCTSAQSPQSDNDIDMHSLKEIGRGTYGVIFEISETLTVIKRPIRPLGTLNTKFDLLNDLKMHKLVEESFQKLAYNKVHIPRICGWRGPHDTEWWSVWKAEFGDEFPDANELLFSERIRPVPRCFRDVITDNFCPEQFRDMTKESTKNEICLVHPLLGRRKGNPTIRGMINLRNYELCVDQMEYLGLGMEVDELVDAMAESLAILHFRGKVNAHDIEFVFGRAPTEMHKSMPSYEEIRKLSGDEICIDSLFASGLNTECRAVHLWMLDFNRVSRIPDDDSFVEMAVYGFVENKAYYPRPRFPQDNDNSADNRNWARFKAAYIDLSVKLRGSNDTTLQDQFLKGVEDHYSNRMTTQERRPPSDSILGMA